jgi:hypothetical protein
VFTLEVALGRSQTGRGQTSRVVRAEASNRRQPTKSAEVEKCVTGSMNLLDETSAPRADAQKTLFGRGCDEAGYDVKGRGREGAETEEARK